MHKVNMFGIPMTVVNEDDVLKDNPDGRHVILCVRVLDQPISSPISSVRKRSLKVMCSVCQEFIWHDPRSSPYPPGAIRVCIPCFTGMTEDQRNQLWNPPGG